MQHPTMVLTTAVKIAIDESTCTSQIFFCRFCLAGRGCGYGDLGIVRPIVKLKIKLSTRGIIGKKEGSVQRNNRGFWGDGGTWADNFTARERFDQIKSLLWAVLAGAKITNQ
jgi:hypothetical protein